MRAASREEHRPIRVLVIDDEKAVRDLFRTFLGPPHFDLVDTIDGQEGLAQMKSGDFDIVISDVMMPGTDGFSICRHIKRDPETTHIPVFLLSGIDDPRLRLTALAAGADHCASKPFDVEELRARIQNAVRMKRLFDACRSGKR